MLARENSEHPVAAHLWLLCKCGSCIDFPPHLMGKQRRAVKKKIITGIRKFSSRSTETITQQSPTAGKENMDVIITTPITTDRPTAIITRKRKRERERERVEFEFRGWIANSNRNQWLGKSIVEFAFNRMWKFHNGLQQP